MASATVGSGIHKPKDNLLRLFMAPARELSSLNLKIQLQVTTLVGAAASCGRLPLGGLPRVKSFRGVSGRSWRPIGPQRP